MHRTRVTGWGRSISYLTARLDAARLTPAMLDECLRRSVDDQIAAAEELPELAHPDAEVTALPGRYS